MVRVFKERKKRPSLNENNEKRQCNLDWGWGRRPSKNVRLSRNCQGNLINHEVEVVSKGENAMLTI